MAKTVHGGGGTSFGTKVSSGGSNTTTSGKFTATDIKLAQKVQDTYGVPASVTLGQYALESNYGKDPVNTNNYFSVKKDGKYRTYASKEESFDAFGKLLSNNRYTSKTSSATNVKEYLQGVKDGGYAEDPNYVKKVMRIITSNNLTKYDTDGTWESGTHGGAGTTFSSTSSTLGLEWWGDVVRVVLVLLIVGGGLVFLAMSAGQLGANVPSVSDVLKGSKGGK